MIPLKIRVYDTKEGYIREVDSIGFVDEEVKSVFVSDCCGDPNCKHCVSEPYKPERYKILQFTGHHDKDGMEVFHYDILGVVYNEGGIIKTEYTMCLPLDDRLGCTWTSFYPEQREDSVFCWKKIKNIGSYYDLLEDIEDLKKIDPNPESMEGKKLDHLVSIIEEVEKYYNKE